MAMHDFHDALPGFDERQILHDGCAECEARGRSRNLGLSYLDAGNARRAMTRAIAWGHGANVGPLSAAEGPLLDMLWAVHCVYEGQVIP